MTDTDAHAVLRIYQDGIDGGNATLETRAPAWEQFDARRLPEHRLVTGVWHRLGCHHGRWRDVMLVEQRSPIVGSG